MPVRFNFVTSVLQGAVFLIILFLLSFPVFASSSVIINSYTSSVSRLEEFSVSFTANGLKAKTYYYIKGRIGKEGETPNKGQTYNGSQWLSDSGVAWSNFPSEESDEEGNFSFTITIRAKETAELGMNRLTIRLHEQDNIDSSPVDIEILGNSSPSPSPSPSLSPSTAIYKINEVKDEDGNALSSVKIYVDGVYLHHYAPETLTFCDGCKCDTYVDCGFGEHTIKLEKSGYQDWSDKKTINLGDSHEISPVMNLSDSVSSSSPSPSPSPSPSLNSSSTSSLKPSPSFQKKTEDLEEFEEASFTGGVLGETESDQATESEESEDKKPFKPSFPLIIILTGLSFLGMASFPLVKPKIKKFIKFISRKKGI